MFSKPSSNSTYICTLPLCVPSITNLYISRFPLTESMPLSKYKERQSFSFYFVLPSRKPLIVSATVIDSQLCQKWRWRFFLADAIHIPRTAVHPRPVSTESIEIINQRTGFMVFVFKGRVEHACGPCVRRILRPRENGIINSEGLGRPYAIESVQGLRDLNVTCARQTDSVYGVRLFS